MSDRVVEQIAKEAERIQSLHREIFDKLSILLPDDDREVFRSVLANFIEQIFDDIAGLGEDDRKRYLLKVLRDLFPSKRPPFDL